MQWECKLFIQIA